VEPFITDTIGKQHFCSLYIARCP